MAKDRRIWIKLAVQMPDSVKISQLSDAAFRAHIEALCYCRDLRTDGVIPRRVAMQRWGAEAIQELMSNDPADPSWKAHELGYEIHDYLEHQESKADIEERERQARAAGAKGGLKRAANRSAKRVANRSAQADPQAEALAKDLAESESELFIPKGMKHRGSRVPDSFAITDEMRTWASREVPLVDVDSRLNEFLDYWRSVSGAKGVKLDWISTWRNAMRRQQEFAQRDAAAKPQGDPNAWMNRSQSEVPKWKQG